MEALGNIATHTLSLDSSRSPPDARIPSTLFSVLVRHIDTAGIPEKCLLSLARLPPARLSPALEETHSLFPLVTVLGRQEDFPSTALLHAALLLELHGRKCVCVALCSSRATCLRVCKLVHAFLMSISGMTVYSCF